MGHQILLIDRDQAQLKQLALWLEASGYRVLRAGGWGQAQALMRSALPDVLLGANWLEVQASWLTTLRSDPRTSKLPVIVISHQADPLFKIAALDAGADDYLVTPCDTGELLARIRAVMRRQQTRQADDMVRAYGFCMDPLTLGVEAQTLHGPQSIVLSPLEFRLLHFLASHPQKVHSRTQLLDRVWGNSVFVGERTVDVHIRKLRVALAGTLCDGLIQTVRGTGYRLMTQRDSDGQPTTAPALRTEPVEGPRRHPHYGALRPMPPVTPSREGAASA